MLFLFLVSAAFYFIPTIVAFNRRKSNRNAILLLNIFLGWTFIGWIVALAWAFTNESVDNRYN
jgi:Superinfection immunity protein